ncbi:hypothetical protein Taro_021606, partial [Colocasia esculenta]|nr:hypothetical protein [Colocasia esculenta]
LSKPISAKEGNKLGLVDIVVSHEELLQVCRQWAVDIAIRLKPWMYSLRLTDKIGSISHAHEIIKAARQEANRVTPNMPQHQACLDAIEEGIIWGGYVGSLKVCIMFFHVLYIYGLVVYCVFSEAKLSKKMMLSSTSKGLIHIFFAQRATSKVPNVTDIGLKPRSIKKVGVIGGGLMGSGIATALLRSDIPVVLKEIDSTCLQKGLKMIEVNLESLVKKGAMSQDKMFEALSILKGVVDYSEFENVDMVIEAVMEKVPLKQTIFREIEKVCPPHCILATNTSSIDLHVVGAKTRSQDRIVGAHFF